MYKDAILFEWDQVKNQINAEKHGLYFEDAHLIFQSETVSFEDTRFNYGEVRYITMGKLNERLIIIVHTLKNNCIRIISMRKANEREQKIYQKRLAKN